jgi:multimeric flavodoxin WrbA
MSQILVLYYSRSGNTEALANAIADGSRQVKDVLVTVKRIDYATVQDFISCDAAAFGSPNYFGYMAGIMKDFFDKAWSIRSIVMGKAAVAFTSGGGNSNSALISIENMLGAFKLEKVAEGVVGVGKPNEQDLKRCKDLGRKLAEAATDKMKAAPKA